MKALSAAQCVPSLTAFSCSLAKERYTCNIPAWVFEIVNHRPNERCTGTTTCRAACTTRKLSGFARMRQARSNEFFDSSRALPNSSFDLATVDLFVTSPTLAELEAAPPPPSEGASAPLSCGADTPRTFLCNGDSAKDAQ